MKEQNIWNPDTGIIDLAAGPKDLGSSQAQKIRTTWDDQSGRLKGNGQLSNFIERLSREWAIETGAIEGLYDIEDDATQSLIEHGFQAKLLSHGSTNKPREYVIHLLHDQKDALDSVFDFVATNRNLSLSYIKELHATLLRSQETTEAIDSQGRQIEVSLEKGTWKSSPNFPVRNGVRYNYCPPEHVDSEMERLLQIHENHIEKGVPVEMQAAWLHHRFAQIHPFQDGNGRVARAIASLVLVKNGLLPLVVTRNDKPDYLETLEQADNGDLIPLIDLIIKLEAVQIRKAGDISKGAYANAKAR